jgi:hypothetical protein
VLGLAAVAAVGWDPVAVRRDQMKDHNVEPILQEVEPGQRPERYRLSEPHVKGLVGLMEVSGSKRRHTGGPL